MNPKKPPVDFSPRRANSRSERELSPRRTGPTFVSSRAPLTRSGGEAMQHVASATSSSRPCAVGAGVRPRRDSEGAQAGSDAGYVGSRSQTTRTALHEVPPLSGVRQSGGTSITTSSSAGNQRRRLHPHWRSATPCASSSSPSLLTDMCPARVRERPSGVSPRGGPTVPAWQSGPLLPRPALRRIRPSRPERTD